MHFFATTASLASRSPSHTHTSKETKALTTACSKLSTLTSTSQPPWERCAHTLTLLLCSALTAYSQPADKAHLHRPTLSHTHIQRHMYIYCFFLRLVMCQCATGLRILGSFSQCNTTMHHASHNCPRAAIAITTTTTTSRRRRRLRGCGCGAGWGFTLYTATTWRLLCGAHYTYSVSAM